ncbi:hypothetical protein [Hymenobacter cellulosivorans]|uniref:Translation initiation factor 2 n=1 Tax=Hymenobacter cellulosivorans TaxID=2932249 RepID=A0ABY4F824_9BACT|nr:hypothetical protein [Hymenobacter cellulosivorans]UOQ52823.1 hypothetical protein MUN80_24160 [Hymenobacter cellulosivorans]
MKHVSGLLHKLTAFAAVVVALSSCNRAEYAMLPKTSSYHGTANRAVAVKPAPEATTPASDVAAAPEATPAPEAAPAVAPAAVATAPAAVAKTTTSVAAVQPAAPAKAQASRKLNLVERAMVAKVVKKANQLNSKTQVKKHSETASANKLSGNIRTGIILLLIGLLLGIFGGVIGLLGAIIALIGVVLIILGLLDEV